MKFNTHHFPAGTIFVLNDDMQSHTTSKIAGEEFEVTKVVRNGHNSYVLETTKKMNPEAFGDMNQAFNITHVKAIIKRGDGPLVFHERDFYPTDFRFLEEKHILADYLNIKIKKTHFAHWSLRDILMFCINNRPVTGSILDMETMLTAVEKQSFVKTFDRNGQGFGCVSVDKKRLKRFLKQNYNRFLVSVEKTQKEQDKMYDEINELDHEAVSGPVVDAIRNETYRLFKESEKLLTDFPTLDKMMEGGVPAGQIAIFASPRPVQGKTMLEQDLVKKHEEDM